MPRILLFTQDARNIKNERHAEHESRGSTIGDRARSSSELVHRPPPLPVIFIKNNSPRPKLILKYLTVASELISIAIVVALVAKARSRLDLVDHAEVTPRRGKPLPTKRIHCFLARPPPHHRSILGSITTPRGRGSIVARFVDRAWKIGAKSREGVPTQDSSQFAQSLRARGSFRFTRREESSRELLRAYPSRAKWRPECVYTYILVYLCTSTAPFRCVFCCRRLNTKTLKRLRATFKVREYPLEVLRRIVECLYSRPGSFSYV